MILVLPPVLERHLGGLTRDAAKNERGVVAIHHRFPTRMKTGRV